MSPLVVQTSGMGTVTPDLNGKVLEAGKIYRVKAVPDRARRSPGGAAWNRNRQC